jgi:hypothetical protein
MMRRVITLVMLIACTCILIMAQEADRVSPAKRPSASRLPLTPPDFMFGQSQTRNQELLPAGQSTKSDTIDSPFVVQNGAVYMKVLNGQLIPMPGGGASGCFSLDLPQRTTNLKEFVPRMVAPEPAVVKQN